MNGASQNRDLNGQIEIEELPPLRVGQRPAASWIKERHLYRWWPPSRLIAILPCGYSVALECYVCPDGVRRFSPADPLKREITGSGLPFYDATAFALAASVGGRALMWDRGDGDPCPLLTQEEARLYYQYAQHLREHLGPTRKLGRELEVCASGRQCRSDKDVLPADLGLDRYGGGERWTIRRLKEEGLRAALQRGLANPTPEDILRLGLLAAAECNPLDITDEESERVTRLALFLLGPNREKLSEKDGDNTLVALLRATTCYRKNCIDSRTQPCLPAIENRSNSATRPPVLRAASFGTSTSAT